MISSGVQIVVVALVTSVVAAAPARPDMRLLKYENTINEKGYKFVFTLSDGQERREQGQLKNPGTEDEALEVTGFYGWVNADGTVVEVSYIADENGYRVNATEGGSGYRFNVPIDVLKSLVG